jgi:hypothetical protein
MPGIVVKTVAHATLHGLSRSQLLAYSSAMRTTSDVVFDDFTHKFVGFNFCQVIARHIFH